MENLLLGLLFLLDLHGRHAFRNRVAVVHMCSNWRRHVLAHSSTGDLRLHTEHWQHAQLTGIDMFIAPAVSSMWEAGAEAASADPYNSRQPGGSFE